MPLLERHSVPISRNAVNSFPAHADGRYRAVGNVEEMRLAAQTLVPCAPFGAIALFSLLQKGGGVRLFDLFKRYRTLEEREILNAMEEFRLGFQEKSPYDVIALQDCFARIQDMLNAKEELPAKMMRVRGLRPLEVVYLICMQWSKRQIESGQHHFNRGVLTAGGKGYARVFDACVSGLVAAERMNTKRAATETDKLHAAIRDAG